MDPAPPFGLEPPPLNVNGNPMAMAMAAPLPMPPPSLFSPILMNP